MNNPTLYTEIERVFKQTPKISGAGRPGTFVLPKSIGSIWTPKEEKEYALVEKWGEGYFVNCPCCGDTRQRLSFSHLYGGMMRLPNRKKPLYFGRSLVRCFNEECQSRRWKELKKYTDQLRSLDMSEIAPSDPASTPQVVSASRLGTTSPIIYPPGSLDLCSDNLPGHALAFFERHNLDMNDLRNIYYCKFTPQGSVWKSPDGTVEVEFFEDRLLIPIIQRRIFVTWQARRFSEEKKHKYTFPDASPASACLYNMDSAWQYKYIAICEGAKDAWRFGGNGTAIFGKTISIEHLEIMRNLWGYDGGAILALDPDARKDASFLKQLLLARKIFPAGVHILELEKDPDEYTRDELMERCEDICPGYIESVQLVEATDEDEKLPVNISLDAGEAINPFAPTPSADKIQAAQLNLEVDNACEAVFGGEDEFPSDLDEGTLGTGAEEVEEEESEGAHDNEV